MLTFGSRNPEIAYPSSHRRIHGAAEMLDAALDTPPSYLETPEQHLETSLGHAVLSGEIDVSGAMVALDEYASWVDDGEPKFGGTTTVAPSVQARI